MILFMGWAGYTFIDQNSQIADKSSELSKKLRLEAQTTQTKAQLERDVKRLNDPEYIGQLARKKYGLYLPGKLRFMRNPPALNIGAEVGYYSVDLGLRFMYNQITTAKVLLNLVVYF